MAIGGNFQQDRRWHLHPQQRDGHSERQTAPIRPTPSAARSSSKLVVNDGMVGYWKLDEAADQHGQRHGE